VSSPSEPFECHWRPSPWLLRLYAVAQLLSLAGLALLGVGPGWTAIGILACLAHALWYVPRDITLSHPQAWHGLRRDAHGWRLWSPGQGWTSVQLQADSVALPWLVVLRVRRSGQWFSRSLCIPADALDTAVHRRLRLRLKFSRSRWGAAE
jgi:toxin CptA